MSKTTETTTFARVLPGAREDYKDSWGAELVSRGVYQLYMGGIPFCENKGMVDCMFAGAVRRIREFYNERRVPVGGKLVMRLRTGEIYIGAVLGHEEEVRHGAAYWDIAHRTPKHIRRSKEVWPSDSPCDDYVLTYRVDWQLVSHPTPAQKAWLSHQVAAVVVRKEVFPSA
jgi:hypothetical protein